MNVCAVGLWRSDEDVGSSWSWSYRQIWWQMSLSLLQEQFWLFNKTSLLPLGF